MALTPEQRLRLQSAIAQRKAELSQSKPAVPAPVVPASPAVSESTGVVQQQIDPRTVVQKPEPRLSLLADAALRTYRGETVRPVQDIGGVEAVGRGLYSGILGGRASAPQQVNLQGEAVQQPELRELRPYTTRIGEYGGFLAALVPAGRAVSGLGRLAKVGEATTTAGRIAQSAGRTAAQFGVLGAGQGLVEKAGGTMTWSDVAKSTIEQAATGAVFGAAGAGGRAAVGKLATPRAKYLGELAAETIGFGTISEALRRVHGVPTTKEDVYFDLLVPLAMMLPRAGEVFRKNLKEQGYSRPEDAPLLVLREAATDALKTEKEWVKQTIETLPADKQQEFVEAFQQPPVDAQGKPLQRLEGPEHVAQEPTKPAPATDKALYDKAVELVRSSNEASVSTLQRSLKIGYAQAARLIDELESNGVVSSFDGTTPRTVIGAEPKQPPAKGAAPVAVEPKPTKPIISGSASAKEERSVSPVEARADANVPAEATEAQRIAAETADAEDVITFTKEMLDVQRNDPSIETRELGDGILAFRTKGKSDWTVAQEGVVSGEAVTLRDGREFVNGSEAKDADLFPVAAKNPEATGKGTDKSVKGQSASARVVGGTTVVVTQKLGLKKHHDYSFPLSDYPTKSSALGNPRYLLHDQIEFLKKHSPITGEDGVLSALDERIYESQARAINKALGIDIDNAQIDANAAASSAGLKSLVNNEQASRKSIFARGREMNAPETPAPTVKESLTVPSKTELPPRPDITADEYYDVIRNQVRAAAPHLTKSRDIDNAVELLKAFNENAARRREMDLMDYITERNARVGELRFARGDARKEAALSQAIGREVKGQFTLRNSVALIEAYSKADISTIFHEIFHFFRVAGEFTPDEYEAMAEFTGAKALREVGRRLVKGHKNKKGEWIPDDVKIKKAVTIDWTDTKTEERFARAGERYLRTGKAPTPKLEALFADIKALMTAIYRKVKGGDIDIKLNEDIKAVFDGMLGADRSEFWNKKRLIKQEQSYRASNSNFGRKIPRLRTHDDQGRWYDLAREFSEEIEGTESAKNLSKTKGTPVSSYFEELSRSEIYKSQDALGMPEQVSPEEAMRDKIAEILYPNNPEKWGESGKRVDWNTDEQRTTAEHDEQESPEAPTLSFVRDLIGKNDKAESRPAPEVSGTVESYKSVRELLRNGTATADDIRRSFEAISSNEESIKAQLSAMTKKQIEELMGRWWASTVRGDDKKSMVNSAYSEMLSMHTVGKSYSYGITTGSRIDAIRKVVNALTEDDMESYRKQVEESRADTQRRVEGYKNPVTFDDFELRILVSGYDSLNADQKAAYDKLRAERGLSSRESSEKKRLIVKAVDIGDVGMNIIETKHTRDGHDLFVVQISDRVERDVYNDLNSKAKQLGGYYSSFRGKGAVPGFQFKSREAAEKFIALKDGDVSRADIVEGRKVEKQQSASARLSEIADNLEEKANEQLSRDRKTNTTKRAREAGYALESAEADLRTAKTIRNIAEALKSGDLKYLSQIKHKTQIEQLDKELRTGYNRLPKEQYGKNAETRPIGSQEDAIRKAELPELQLYGDHMSRLAGELEKAVGAGPTKMLSAWVRKRATGNGDKYFNFDSEVNGEEIAEKIVAKMGKSAPWQLRDSLNERRRLRAMGITNSFELREALREYVQFLGEKREVSPLKKAELDLVGKNIEGFFPTPRSVIDRMMENADIREGMSVLEPSAGKGDIADAIREAGVEPDVHEISTPLRSILAEKGYANVGGDFLKTTDKKYDRIVMNPPFENGADIDHVMFAYNNALLDGGRIVAIMSEGPFFRNDKKSQAFREWLDSVGGESEKLPEGSFKSSFRPTGVATRLVTIVKEHESPFQLGESLFQTGEPTNEQLRKSPFYLKSERVIQSKIPNRATGEQIRKTLLNNGVKPDEIKWVLDDLFAQKGDEQITKAELLEHIAANQAVKVEDVTLGKKLTKNDLAEADKKRTLTAHELQAAMDKVKEHFVRLGLSERAAQDVTNQAVYDIDSLSPEIPGEDNTAVRLVNNARNAYKRSIEATDNYYKAESGFVGNTKFSSYKSIPGGENYRELVITLPNLGGRTYKSSHWDSKNPVAHIRMDDRVNADGNRVLFVHEMQSDWNREGREKGFAKNDDEINALIKELGEQREALRKKKNQAFRRKDEDQVDAIEEQINDLSSEILNLQSKKLESVPDAPFVRKWQELVAKKVVEEAATGGYDRIAWATGEQVANMFDLRDTVEFIEWNKNGDDYDVYVHLTNKDDLDEKTYTAKQLRDTFGKDIADKIINSKEDGDTIEGDDLAIGGEWAGNLYDREFPALFSKIGKRWGQRSGETEVFQDESDKSFVPKYKLVESGDGEFSVAWANGENSRMVFSSKSLAKEWADGFVKKGARKFPVNSIAITPEMRRAILSEGQELFQVGDDLFSGDDAKPESWQDLNPDRFWRPNGGDTEYAYFKNKTPDDKLALLKRLGFVKSRDEYFKKERYEAWERPSSVGDAEFKRVVKFYEKHPTLVDVKPQIPTGKIQKAEGTTVDRKAQLSESIVGLNAELKRVKAVLSVEPNNAAALKQRTALTRKIAEAQQEISGLDSDMFNPTAGPDDQGALFQTGERAADPNKLDIVKRGGTVGFDKDGRAITVKYSSGAKSWQVHAYRQVGSATIPDDSKTRNFDTKGEAAKYAASMLDYSQTMESESNSWLNPRKDLFAGRQSEPATATAQQNPQVQGEQGKLFAGIPDPASVVSTLSPPVKKLGGRLAQTFSSTLPRLEKTRIGGEIVQKIVTAETRAKMFAGELHATLDADQAKLTKQDIAWLNGFDAIEQGRANSIALLENLGDATVMAKAPSDRIKRFAWSFRAVTDQVADRAEGVGVKVVVDGEQRDFERIDQYFPHWMTRAAHDAILAQEGPVWSAMLKRLREATGNDEATYEDRLRQLQAYAEGDIEVHREGSLEKPRLAFLPDYVTVDGKRVKILESNIFDVADDMIERHSRRLAIIEQFGQGDKQFNEYHRKLYRDDQALAWDFQNFVAPALQGLRVNRYSRHGWYANAYRPVSALANKGLLSAAVLSQVGGTIAIPMQHGVRNTAKTVLRLMKSGKTGELEQMRRLRGFYSDILKVIGETDAFTREGYEGLDGNMAQRGLRSANRAADVYLRNTLGRADRIINDITSLAAIRSVEESLAAIGRGDSGFLNKAWGTDVAGQRRNLKRFYQFTDAQIDEMIQRGRLTNEERARIVQRAPASTNAAGQSVLDRPAWMHHDIAKHVFAFSSYVQAIGRYAAWSVREAKLGNMRPVLGLMVGGVISGELEIGVKNWFNDREREDKNFADRLMNDILRAGVLGLAGSLYQSAQYAATSGNSAVNEQLSPPPVDALESLRKAVIKSGEKKSLLPIYYDSMLRNLPALRILNTQGERLIYGDRESAARRLIREGRLANDGGGKKVLLRPRNDNRQNTSRMLIRRADPGRLDFLYSQEQAKKRLLKPKQEPATR